MLWVRSFVRCQASCVLELEAIQSRRNTFLMVTQLPLQVGNGVPAKTWKRSVTHVHVSHLIQVHLDKKGEGGGKTATHPPPQCVWTAPGPAKDGEQHGQACAAAAPNV
jgi:hypothetical protein